MKSFKEFLNTDKQNDLNETSKEYSKILSDTERTVDNCYRGINRSIGMVYQRDVEADIANRLDSDIEVLTQLYATKYVYDELKHSKTDDVQGVADSIVGSSFFKQIKNKQFKNHVIYALRFAGAKV